MRRLAARWRLRSLLRAAAPLLLIGLLAGCMLPPTPATTTAKSVWWLYLIVFGMGAAVFFAVEGFILYAIFRYRRRDDRLPNQLHGNNRIEMVWTAIPTVIVLIMFVVSMISLAEVEARSPEPYLEVEVIGFQWQWTFRYLDGDTDPSNDYSVTGAPGAPPTLTVPVGKPVRLILHSDNVIHSFYVRNFLIKRDLVPLPNGRNNELELTVSEPGVYAGQCAEFCGDLHAEMTFNVEALPLAEFDAWLASVQAGGTPQPTPSPGTTTVALVADLLAFNIHQIDVAAGAPFVISLDNREAFSHNVSIYRDGERIFFGDYLQGPATTSYQVPGLQAGEYTFICDVHPIPGMTGTLTVE
ncbi:MAG TPA: cytochrome c oxidase subunit II [Candidatus Limnocylindria bacterium]|nr:cytochrome c oxidase subunit II [Candidatus Limnocylindria bacterium]